MEEVFTSVYKTRKWGDNYCSDYEGSSGPGSSIPYNINTYVPFLKNFIQNNNIKTVVDLGCGDFRCGQVIYNDMDVTYTGYDAYKKVVEHNKTKAFTPKFNFIHLDFCHKKEEIETADLCILKDVIQHWSLQNIYQFLDYLVENKLFKYILIINCGNQKEDNTDIPDGEYRELSCNFFPLKKYNTTVIYKYDTKECSVIRL
jgi:SAM-dependent methyltransferase